MTRMRELRLQHGLTAKQMANQLHLSESSVTLYETGKREPTPGTLWYTAVVEVENLGETTLQLSSCTLDVENASGALVATLDLGTSVPEVIDPGETAYYVETSTLDVALPEGYQLVTHAKFGEHAAPVRGNHGGGESGKKLKKLLQNPLTYHPKSGIIYTTKGRADNPINRRRREK